MTIQMPKKKRDRYIKTTMEIRPVSVSISKMLALASTANGPESSYQSRYIDVYVCILTQIV